jgi:hypothetical protein
LRSQHIWETILPSSDRLRLPVHLSDASSGSLFDIELVSQTLRAMALDSTDFPRACLRVYVSGQSDSNLEAAVLENPPQTGQSLEGWSVDLFSDNEFSIVLNRVERYNDALCCQVARLLRPLREEYLVPPMEFEITFFVGNCHFTPFGAHIDRLPTTALHLVLGPHSRQMVLWDPETYKSLTGNLEPLSDPTEILQAGRSFRLRPSDYFLLPATEYYHVGINEGFSVALAVAIFDRTTADFIQQALRHIQSPSPSLESSDVWRPTALNKDQTLFRTRVPSTEALDAEHSAATTIENHYLEKVSNLGLRFPPLPRADGKSVHDNTRLKLLDPFRIVVLDRGERLSVFFRGQSFAIKNHVALIDLFARLNRSTPIRVADIIRRYDGVLSRDVILNITQVLATYRIVDMEHSH